MEKEISKVVTRFAPSPTGNLHVGSVRTALFNFLYAKKMGGKLILRIEDTDKERSKREYEEDILAGLKWLGLTYDEFFRQSERTEIYKKYLNKLVDEDIAYVSKEEAKDGSGEIKEIIRFRNLNKKVTFSDEIRGDVTFDTTDLGDFVIAKDFGSPLYHFVVVVDDFEMGITHVIRGEDHISNTPRQILIQEAIGAHRPIYAHLPLILASDRSKMSKRHGAVSTEEYRKMGYLPEALNNFLALIGWNPGDDREVFKMEELVEAFSLEKIQKSGGIFNMDKLMWINKEHIKHMERPAVLKEVKKRLEGLPVLDLPKYSDEQLDKILEIIIERIHTFDDVTELAKSGEYDYWFVCPKCDTEIILWKKKPDAKLTKENLTEVVRLLEEVSEETFNEDGVKDAIWDYVEDKGRGDVLWPMRYALSGREKSPAPFVLAELLGKEETLCRLKLAIERLSA